MRLAALLAATLALAGCDRSRDIIVEAEGPWAGYLTGGTYVEHFSGGAGVTRHAAPNAPRCFAVSAESGTVRVRVEGAAHITDAGDMPAVSEGAQAVGCYQ